MIHPKIDVLQRLKDETRSLHSRLDKLPMLTQLLDESLSLAEYIFALKKFYGFYLPLELQLAKRHNWTLYNFNFESRAKTRLLWDDLLSMKAENQSLPLCKNLPQVNSSARALGCLYVLEGATLGGQVIAPRVQKSLQLSSEQGVKFFSSYGEVRVKSSWLEVKALLVNTLQNSQNRFASAASSAVETFTCLENWLNAPYEKTT